MILADNSATKTIAQPLPTSEKKEKPPHVQALKIAVDKAKNQQKKATSA
jgi:hypothetical protein